jgi:hypothetical protein
MITIMDIFMYIPIIFVLVGFLWAIYKRIRK